MHEKYDIQRFRDAHADSFRSALMEIKNGRKDGHWMWYIFPQPKGFGKSCESEYYGFVDVDEARAYFNDVILYEHMILITTALLGVKTNDIHQVFTDNVDCLKLQTCMTLFYHIAEEKRDKLLFEAVINRFYDGKFDEAAKIFYYTM
jgi:Uncharacterized conserved protein